MRTSIRITVILTILFTSNVFADLWDAPVAPGETFHWVFVTSTTTNAASNEIATYNAFVDGVASDLGETIFGDITWVAIASTPGTSAKTNIDAIGGIRGPIYLLDSTTMIASNSASLWDASIDHSLSMDEHGNWIDSDYSVWTGSWWDGEGNPDNELGGTGLPISGNASLSDKQWIASSSLAADSTLRMYAISEGLTVVPVPGSLLLGILGLSVAGVKLRKSA